MVVEGPFARNKAYLWMLAVATGTPVEASLSATGTSQGAALLACAGDLPPLPQPVDVAPPDDLVDVLKGYAQGWRDAVVPRLQGPRK